MHMKHHERRCRKSQKKQVEQQEFHAVIVSIARSYRGVTVSLCASKFQQSSSMSSFIKSNGQTNTIQMRKWNSKFLRSKMFFCFVSLFCQKIAVDTFVFSFLSKNFEKNLSPKISILKQGLVSSDSGKTQSQLTNK